MGTITNKGENPMYSKDLFDVKFDNLKNTFDMPDETEVYEFIKSNENMFKLLDELKPYLNKHFNDKEYYLEVNCYPEIYRPELELVISTEANEDAEELTEKFLNVSLGINDSQIELGLIGKFSITLE